ncbi:acyltransferase family protein [Arthrobacter sunyaminii]|uniref:acyltransferase family protein n=1 Tax=Arthrobacter sunyaminii TaxID=2816859 RepID=UPI001A94772A|nr:acyltransferase [Arthrobacter sunyaminii]MBO0896451.1 acyltransferase [Arthrobacter sunyaminii]
MDARGLKKRIQWMDALRGIAIVLVIVFHAVSMTAGEGDWVPPWAMQINLFFLPYRMPILMFLSGLLLTSSLRKSTFQYYGGKVRLLVWPYIVWTAVYILVVGTEYSIYQPSAWLPHGNYLWFLAYITAYYFVAPLIKRVPVWILPIALLVASIIVDSGFLYFSSFFFLGHSVSVRRDFFEQVLSSRWVPVGGLVACGFGIFAMFVDVEHVGQYAPLSVVGIVSAIWLVRRIENYRFVEPLGFLGRKSLIFYVSHVPVISICLEIGRSIGINNSAVLIPLCISIAVLCGYVLSLAASTMVGRWLFEMPHIGHLLRRKKSDSTSKM